MLLCGLVSRLNFTCEGTSLAGPCVMSCLCRCVSAPWKWHELHVSYVCIIANPPGKIFKKSDLSSFLYRCLDKERHSSEKWLLERWALQCDFRAEFGFHVC